MDSGTRPSPTPGWARPVAPVSELASLTVTYDLLLGQLGYTVACTDEGVGDWPTALAVGGPVIDKSWEQGHAGLFDGSRTGVVHLLEADVLTKVPDDRDWGEAMHPWPYSLAFLGDVDGDARNDWGGAERTLSLVQSQAGGAFLLPTAPGVSTLDQAPTRFDGYKSGQLFDVKGAGDLDRDGVNDLVFAHFAFFSWSVDRVDPSVTVLRGRSFGASRSVRPVDAEILLTEDSIGARLGDVGDLNGDGWLDLVVGDAVYPYGLGRSKGRVLVLFGPVMGRSVTAEEVDLVLEGGQTDAAFGHQAVVGDWNADHRLDLAVSAGWLDGKEQVNAGAVYIYFGPFSAGRLQTSEANLVIEGEGSGGLGTTMVALDHDGDGYQDLAISEPGDRYAGVFEPGQVLVHLGPFTGGVRGGTRDADRVLQDDQVLARFGWGLSACDLDLDGRDDLVIGAPDWRGTEDDWGRVWVVPGREP